MTHRCLSSSVRRPAGFSLVEMVVSLAVITVLMFGMTSAVVLASRALPTNDGPAAATVTTARALHQLQDELRAATELLNRTATSVTLHLPDRDGDGTPEVIVYQWAGNPGDPLTRTANGGAPQTLLAQVQDLSLTYVLGQDVTAFPGSVGSPSAEIELSRYDPGNSTDEVQLRDDDRIGFRFTPALPGTATAWRVTRVLMRTSKSGGSGGQATFELTGWDAGVGPDSSILESVNVPETALDRNQNWAQIDFDTGGPFDPGDTAAISLQDTGGGTAANILWNNSGSPVNAHRSSNGGTVWTTTSGAVDHYVYGTYEAAGDDWTFTRPRLTAVGITLIGSGAKTTTHRLRVPLINTPDAADALWVADFNADPTAFDGNADGQADWQATSAFDSTRLANGGWAGTDKLHTSPDGFALDQPFTLEVWVQDLEEDDNGGGVRLALDQNNGSLGVIVLALNLDEDSNDQSVQTVVAGHEDASGTLTPWFVQNVVAGEPVHITLTADPDRDQVNLRLNQTDMGSFTYPTFSASDTKVLQLYTDSSSAGVVFKHVRLAVAGTVAVTPDAYAGSGADGVVGEVIEGVTDTTNNAIDATTGTVNGLTGNSSKGSDSSWFNKLLQ